MIEICVVNGGIPFRLGDVAPIQSLRGRRHILKGRLCFGRPAVKPCHALVCEAIITIIRTIYIAS